MAAAKKAKPAAKKPAAKKPAAKKAAAKPAAKKAAAKPAAKKAVAKPAAKKATAKPRKMGRACTSTSLPTPINADASTASPIIREVRGLPKEIYGCIYPVYVPFNSFDFILRLVYPHFLHLVARTEFRALHFMQIFMCNSTFSASGNLAIVHLCLMKPKISFFIRRGHQSWTAYYNVIRFNLLLKGIFSFLPGFILSPFISLWVNILRFTDKKLK